MFGKNKERRYESRTFDLNDTNDFEVFYGIIDTLNDFDFAVGTKMIVYLDDYSKAKLYVNTSEKMMEIWLTKKGFEEA